MKKYLFYFLVLALAPKFTPAQSALTIGPTLHLNIGEEPSRLSFGVEAAYWNLEKFPTGINLG